MFLIKFAKLKSAFYIVPLVAASISSCTSDKEIIYPATSTKSITPLASQVTQTVEIPKPGNVNYERYYNDRFKFSILYPNGLLNKQDAPVNNDGRTFISDNSNIVMNVFGRYNTLNFLYSDKRAIKKLYRRESNQPHRDFVYKELGDYYFLVSYYNKFTKLFYYKKVLLINNRILTLTLRYDKSLKPELDSIVEKISRSFHGYERT